MFTSNNFEKIVKTNRKDRNAEFESKGRKLNKVKRDRSAKRNWME